MKTSLHFFLSSMTSFIYFLYYGEILFLKQYLYNNLSCMRTANTYPQKISVLTQLLSCAVSGRFQAGFGESRAVQLEPESEIPSFTPRWDGGAASLSASALLSSWPAPAAFHIASASFGLSSRPKVENELFPLPFRQVFCHWACLYLGFSF